jgi:hypothetical protein
MALAPLIVTAAETSTSGVDPIYVGGGIFVFLLVMLLGLLAFGAGRDHS